MFYITNNYFTSSLIRQQRYQFSYRFKLLSSREWLARMRAWPVYSLLALQRFICQAPIFRDSTENETGPTRWTRARHARRSATCITKKKSIIAKYENKLSIFSSIWRAVIILKNIQSSWQWPAGLLFLLIYIPSLPLRLLQTSNKLKKYVHTLYILK